MRRKTCLAAFGVGAALVSFVLVLAFAGNTAARETTIVSFAERTKFAPMWGGGAFDVATDTAFPAARLVSAGDGKGTFVSNVRGFRPVHDFTGKFVKVWIKAEGIDHLGGIEFRLSSDRFASNHFAFALSKYDDADFNVLREGVWTPLTFSFGSARVEGEPDRSAINGAGWYVADTGGEGRVTAYWGGLSALDEPSEGVLSFTFDDGYDEHHLAAELMAAHGFRGTAYVIPEAIGGDGYMTLHQLVDLHERLGWDVAAHHETPFTEMAPEMLENEILGVQRFLIDNEFDRGAGHLAYPLGRQNPNVVRPIVRKYFTTARIAADGPETLPPADSHLLRVFNVTPKTTPEQVGEAARRARENREWLILMLHYLVEKPQQDIDYSIDDFKRLLAAVKASGIRVLPLSEVWDACAGAPPGEGQGEGARRCAFPPPAASPAR
jgi:peptidoglycan/xylan/chitin deacetylase (PgdA/CDA1 family)